MKQIASLTGVGVSNILEDVGFVQIPLRYQGYFPGLIRSSVASHTIPYLQNFHPQKLPLLFFVIGLDTTIAKLYEEEDSRVCFKPKCYGHPYFRHTWVMNRFLHERVDDHACRPSVCPPTGSGLTKS